MQNLIKCVSLKLVHDEDSIKMGQSLSSTGGTPIYGGAWGRYYVKISTTLLRKNAHTLLTESFSSIV